MEKDVVEVFGEDFDTRMAESAHEIMVDNAEYGEDEILPPMQSYGNHFCPECWWEGRRVLLSPGSGVCHRHHFIAVFFKDRNSY